LKTVFFELVHVLIQSLVFIVKWHIYHQYIVTASKIIIYDSIVRFLVVVLLWCLVETTSSHPTSFICCECCSLQTCRWTGTSLRSVPSAFSSCDNYAVSDVR